MVAGFDNAGFARLITRIYSQKEKRTARSGVEHEESRVVAARKVIGEEPTGRWPVQKGRSQRSPSPSSTFWHSSVSY